GHRGWIARCRAARSRSNRGLPGAGSVRAPPDRSRRAMSALLEIDKLCVWYGPVFALKDATLSVGSGEAVALIGANGAGKSTLFKSIVGFQRTKSGALR